MRVGVRQNTRMLSSQHSCTKVFKILKFLKIINLKFFSVLGV